MIEVKVDGFLPGNDDGEAAPRNDPVDANVPVADPFPSTEGSDGPSQAAVPQAGAAVAPWEVASEVRSGLSGAAAPIEAIFAVGERVSYWSDTHKQWMEAVVTKQNLHPHGAVMSYDLDVKRGARPDKMRRMTHINEAASASGNSASGPVTVHVTSGTDIVQPHPPHVAKDSQVPSAMTPARFEIGDRVEYWSETYSQWMQAIVQKVRDDGITYDLDVKRGAQRKKMRASQGLAESSAPAPNSVPQTCAAGLQAVPAEPRGPSPLSGRVRSAGDGTEREDTDVGAFQPEAARACMSALAAPSAQVAVVPAAASESDGYPVIATAALQSDAEGPAAIAKFRQNSPNVMAQDNQPKQFPTPFATANVPQKVDAPSHQTPSPEQTPQIPSTQPSQPSQLPQTTPAQASASTAGRSPLSAVPAASVLPGIGRTASLSHAASLPGAPVRQLEAARRDPVAANVSSPSVSPHRAGIRMPTLPAARGVVEPPPAAASVYAASTPSSAMTAPARTLEVGEVNMGAGTFDPEQPGLQAQLLQKLGVVQGTGTITPLPGFQGGLNEGVWILSGTMQSAGSQRGRKDELVLKLVRCKRIAPSILTEAENFLELQKSYPSLAADPSLAFPMKILSCMGPGNVKRHDLIVMRKLRGDRLAELIATKWYGNQVPQLMDIFEKLGECLAEFHRGYGNAQHGDFQPSNVLYDEEENKIALIDMGGMGVPTTETDVEHFTKSMTLLSQTYGHKLYIDGMRRFNQGYSKRRG